MHFRHLISSLFFAVTLSACGLHFNQSQKPNVEKTAGATQNCLVGASQTLQDFANGKAPVEKVTGVFNCAAESLQLFIDTVEGSQSDSYTPSELSGFLTKFFLDGKVIPAPLMAEVLNFKHSFLGGSTDRLTHEDIRTAIRFIRLIRDESIRIAPFMPFDLESYKNAPREKVDAAISAVQLAVSHIGQAISNNGDDYTFSHLESLILHLGTFMDSDMAESIRKNVDMIRLAKQILIAPPQDSVQKNEWQVLLDAGARWFGVTLKLYNWYNTKTSFTIGEDRARFMSFIREMRLLIDEMIKRHPDEVIRFREFDDLINSFDAETLPVKKEILIKFMRPLIQRMFGGFENDKQGRLAEGVTLGMTQRIFDGFEDWNTLEGILEALFRSMGERTFEEGGFLPNELIAQLPTFWSDRLQSKDPRTQKMALVAQKMILEHRPMFTKNKNRIYFPKNGVQLKHTFYNLSQMAWIRQLATFLITGYSEDRTRSNLLVGLNYPEWDRFSTDVQELLWDILFVEPQNTSFHQTRFRETRLFTFAGDGGKYMTLNQLTQLMGFMLSGRDLSHTIHDDIESICKARDPEHGVIYGTGYGFPKIEQKCYYENLAKKMDTYLEDFMPELQKYFDGMTLEEREKILRKAMIAAAIPADHYIALTDTESIGTMFNYMEAIFWRYDLDGSSTVSHAEGQAAFQVLGSEIEVYSPIKGRLPVESIFDFLMAKGTDPSQHTMKVLGFIMKNAMNDSVGKILRKAFPRWKQKHPKLDFVRYEADRDRLMDIFIAIYNLAIGTPIRTTLPPLPTPTPSSSPTTDSGTDEETTKALREIFTDEEMKQMGVNQSPN